MVQLEPTAYHPQNRGQWPRPYLIASHILPASSKTHVLRTFKPTKKIETHNKYTNYDLFFGFPATTHKKVGRFWGMSECSHKESL